MLKTENTSNRLIEDFRGDFKKIAFLMKESWSENKIQPLLYTKEFLESCFEYPGANFKLAPTIYHKNTPKAFVAGFPRRVRYRERELNILLITFLTVAPEYKKTGYGIIVWSDLVRRAREAGFDGMMNYCVDGEAMNSMIMGCCNRMNLAAEHVYSVRYLTSLLLPRSQKDEEKATSLDIDAVMRIGNSIANHSPLARVWNRNQAEWQCKRSGAIVARIRTGSREGMITGYIMRVADDNRTKCLFIEDILWGNLKEERETLVKALTAKAVAAGAQLAVAPMLGYADMEPFKRTRFRPSQKVLHAYFTNWSAANTAVGPLSSFYLDVY